MKRVLLFFVFCSVTGFLSAQTVITIGPGTDSQPYPFNLWGGYARSASIYTLGEIGTSGVITSLAWNVVTSDVESCPVKIYLGHISDGSLYSISWGDLVDGATLVYDASVNFPNTGWKTIDIADFVYNSTGGKNLLVLCEANYGGNGAPSYPFFSYSYNPDMHEYWQQYETPPTDPGITDPLRPDIQITWVPLTTPHPPSGFMAQTAGTGQIDLTWKKNAASNNVMIAYNTTSVFGNPAGTYVAGNSIAGGGTVIYIGPASGYSHVTGLNPATTYYYRAWSVLPPVPGYSVGTNTSATTQCVALQSFPNITQFESETFPPVCWTIAQKPWVRNGSVSAFGTGTGSVYANFYNINIPSGASFDLVSPDLDLSGLSNPVVSFDHAYATYSTEVDILELWVSYDYGASYSLLTTWPGGLNGSLNTGGQSYTSFVPTAGHWASKSYAVNPGVTKFIFRGISALGNNLYIDNITINDQAIIWNGSVSAQWSNPSNWTPNAVPASDQNVIISPASPNFPVVSGITTGCRNLLIKSGAMLTIIPGAVLTLTGDLTIQDETATIPGK